MSSQDALSQWKETVSTYLPHLSGPQVLVLAMWSYAMIFARSCGTTLCGAWLAELVGGSEEAWRQRLREWYYDAPDKKGTHRQQIEVRECFAPLFRWVLSWWPAEQKRVALAIDASTLSDRFTVLCISVLYRRCAIPVAWCVLRANAPGEWKPLWLDLLDALAGSVPQDWTVLVMADRGLYARWLYQHIQHLGWHPFLRLNKGGKARPKGQSSFHWLATFAPVHGYVWSGQVRCFTESSSRLDCTLLACWDAEHSEAWLIVTDLPPDEAQVAWYGMRFWIECGFKDSKRGGWDWYYTKMQDPKRAERVWLVMAVATLWVVGVGAEREASQDQRGWDELLAEPDGNRTNKRHRKYRRLSCFSRGLIALTIAVLRGDPLPVGNFVAFDWPQHHPQKESQEEMPKTSP